MSKKPGQLHRVNDEPYEMFGKTMSITDELICRYFELLTRVPMEDINQIKNDMAAGTLNPRDAKIHLAMELITMYHSAEDANQARDRFLTVFSKRDIPEDIPELKVSETEVWLPKFLNENGLVDSASDGKRMIKQGGLKINNQKYADENIVLEDGMVIQVGKRKFIKVLV